MRISDWSSDVCSSDLLVRRVPDRVSVAQCPYQCAQIVTRQRRLAGTVFSPVMHEVVEYRIAVWAVHRVKRTRRHRDVTRADFQRREVAGQQQYDAAVGLRGITVFEAADLAAAEIGRAPV